MNTIVVSDSTPIVTETIVVEKPTTTAGIPLAVTEPSIVTPVEANNSIIIDPLATSITKEEFNPIIEVSSSVDIPEPEIIPNTDWSNDIINNISNDSPLYDMITAVPEKANTPEINFSEVEIKPVASTPEIKSTARETSTFGDTAGYISHAIEEVD